MSHVTPAALNNEFQVNTYTSQHQNFPSVASLAEGGFVICWQSSGQDGSASGVYAQRFAADGTPVGEEVRVNSYVSSEQAYPSVAGLAGGGFVVTWQSLDQDRDNYGIYGQRFGADGVALDEEFLINTTTVGVQDSCAVAALADGGYVVSWNSYDGSGKGIYAQRFADDGTPVGGEFLVNGYTTLAQSDASIAALADGGFVVSWQSRAQDGSGDGIYAQRFAADGSRSGEEFRVNSVSYLDQTAPSVASLADGGFVVAWQSVDQDGSGDGSGEGIYIQRFAADGTPMGEPQQGNTFTTGDQESPAVTGLADGGFVVTWESYAQDGSGEGIFGQRFAADGTPLGEEFQANTFTNTSQSAPAVATLDDGSILVTWQSGGFDGDGTGVSAQRFTVGQLNHTPEITGELTGSVKEDLVLSATGQLLVTDEVPEAVTWSLENPLGSYGTLSLDGNGGWHYLLNNDAPEVQALTADALVTDVFVVRATDNQGSATEQALTITLTGADEPSFSIEGEVRYWSDASQKVAAQVRLLQAEASAEGVLTDSVSTDASGHYRFDGVLNGDYLVEADTSLGDGGAVTAADVALLLDAATGKANLSSPHQAAAADINQDGQTTAQDALLALLQSEGLVQPAGWEFVHNPISGLAADQVGADIVAVLLGDVGGSWQMGLEPLVNPL